jgi:hypothetical protein
LVIKRIAAHLLGKIIGNQYLYRQFNFSANMISKTKNLYNLLCEQCFLSLKPLNKWRKDFIKDVLWLSLSVLDRINFSQLGRYGKYCEQRYRQEFEKDFDFSLSTMLL